MAGNAGAVKAGGAYVSIGGDSSDLEKALARIGRKFAGIASTMTAAGRDLTKIGLSITAPIVLAAKTFESMGENIFRAAQRTGVGVESLSALRYAAQQSGVGMEGLETGIKRMQRTLGDAAMGVKESEQSFRALGLSVDDLKGMTADQQLAKIAGALNQIHDPTAKAAEAMKIFGRNGTEMLPLLAQGAAGINAMTARAKALGIIIGTDAARNATVFHNRIADLSDVLKNSLFRAGEAVTPVLLKIVENVTRGVIAVNQWISAHEGIVVTALEVGASVIAAGGAFLAMGYGMRIAADAAKGLGSALSLARAGLSVIPALLGGILNPVGLVVVGLAAVGAYLAYNTETGRTMLKALGGYFGDLKDVATEAFGGIRDALAAGDWKLAADVAWAGLKVAWTEGIAPLKTLWLGLEIAAEEAWNKIKSSVLDVTYKTIAVLKNAWEEFKHWYENLINSMGNSLANHDENNRHDARVALLKQQFNPDERLTAKSYDAAQKMLLDSYMSATNVMSASQYDALSRALFEKFKEDARAIKDYEGELGKENRYHDRQIGAVDDLSKRQIAANDAVRDAALSKNKADLDSSLNGTKQKHDAEQKRIDDAAASGAAANQKDLDDKKAKLAALVNQAKKEGGGKSLFNALPNLLPPPGLGGVGSTPNGDDLDRMMSAVKAAGTFSARGAAGLAGGDIPRQQLSAMERIEKLLDKTKEQDARLLAPLASALLLG